VDASGATEITAWGSPDTPFPGGKKITSFTSTTNPNSKSYAGTDTFVSVTGIPSESQTMPMQVGVSKAS
jgi:immune inhibitor A